MRRFYLPPSQCTGPVWNLSESDARHAVQVLRTTAGEPVVILDGAGGEWRCEVIECGRKHVRLKPGAQTRHKPLPARVTLVQAITKGKSMDWIVQKATELGVSRIVPVLSDRSVPSLDDEAAEDKVEKWMQIAIESIKQCGSPWLPTIEPPRSVQAILQHRERFECALVASLAPEARHPRTVFDAFRRERGRGPISVAVWVGPEGDFTPAELADIGSAGFTPITLGPLVLRSETAAAYCLSIISYETGGSPGAG
ncbi:MAG: 16S rRNA (uracil(1498)-N(3))-methyltransferase [Verrucomicrobia bacterium]|nr:16S rRNA (uracil(1498)-N(3))-methyltransferase [Verrucomicrobiota bacterium]